MSTVLRAARWVDVDDAELRSPAVLVVDGERIVAVDPAQVPNDATVIDLGDVTLLPGLMDMELNMLLGGPSGGKPRSHVEERPPFRPFRGILKRPPQFASGFPDAPDLGPVLDEVG